MFFKIVISSLLLLSTSAFASGFAPVANIVKIKGNALINNAKVREGAEVASGMKLDINKKNDYVEVKFQNGHVIRLVGAHVKIEDITPKSAVFHLVSGKIFSVIQPLTEGESYIVKTRTTSFNPKAAKFFVEENKKESYILVSEGEVEVRSNKNDLVLTKDQDLYIRGKGALKTRPASKNMLDLSNSTFKDMNVL